MSTHEHARVEAWDAARGRLLESGAQELPRAPWQHPNQPPSDLELVRYAAWRAGSPDVDPELCLAGIRLLAEARTELDQIEAALLFASRAAGSTFPQIAEALGLRTAQAAQQRMSRVVTRVGGVGE